VGNASFPNSTVVGAIPSTSSGSNRPESEGDGQGQEKDWRVRNTRGWLNQEVNFAVSAHKKHGQPKQKKVEYHRDPNILLQAVDEPEKKAASLRKGGCALIARGRTLLTLAEAVESAFGLLPPEDTASDSAE